MGVVAVSAAGVAVSAAVALVERDDDLIEDRVEAGEEARLAEAVGVALVLRPVKLFQKRSSAIP